MVRTLITSSSFYQGRDSDGGNVDNFPTVLPGFSLMPCYKKHKIPPFRLVKIMSNDEDEEEDDKDELTDETVSEASSTSGNGSGVE
jgi:hypothetical protein